MARKTKLALPAQAVPQTRDEADRLLGEIALAELDLQALDAQLAAEVTRVTEATRAKAAPIAAERDAKLQALAAWAEASKSTLLEGDRRLHDLAHGTIGWRRTPPKVHVTRGLEDAVVAELLRRRLRDLLRVTTTIDKAAILADPERVATVPGLTVKGGEIFFAKPNDVSTELQLSSGRVTRAAEEPTPESATAA